MSLMDNSRRDFLAKGTAAALSGRFAFSQIKSDRKIRVAIVGGGFGTGFYFHEHPNCTVEAVSDLRPERRELLMKTYRCAKSYESLEKLVFDKNIEAVFLATPAPDHVRHVKLVLNSGKHVMSAVPAAWASIEQCHELVDAVRKSGLTYMMSETSYFNQGLISARKFYKEGRFGNIFYTEAEYHHPGLEQLYFEKGNRTWRYGMAPMHYPTHCTAFLIGLTGERLTEVTGIGWGDGHPILKDNPYKNPFWNATALFKTNKGNAFRVAVYWRGAEGGCERAQWYGDKMSFFLPHPNGVGSVIRRATSETEKDSGGFSRTLSRFEKYEQPQWWNTDMLPDALHHNSGHAGSHTFLTHEFIESLVEKRRPAVDVYEAIAYTAPGIVAHESALKGGVQMKIPQFDRP